MVKCFFICLILLATAGCSAKKTDSEPEIIAKSIAEAVLLVKESDTALNIIGKKSSTTRKEFVDASIDFYKKQGGFTTEQATDMVNTLFAAIDDNIIYSVSDATFRGDSAAIVDIFIKSYDQNDFSERCDEIYNQSLPPDFDSLSEQDQLVYSYEAFIAACKNIKLTNKDSVVSVDFFKDDSGWVIVDPAGLVINLLAVYMNSTR